MCYFTHYKHIYIFLYLHKHLSRIKEIYNGVWIFWLVAKTQRFSNVHAIFNILTLPFPCIRFDDHTISAWLLCTVPFGDDHADTFVEDVAKDLSPAPPPEAYSGLTVDPLVKCGFICWDFLFIEMHLTWWRTLLQNCGQVCRMWIIISVTMAAVAMTINSPISA